MKILFVCSRNRRRSLTAEHLFKTLSEHHIRSAGTEEGARIRITAGHIGWADIIFVMERRHLDRLRAKFGQELVKKQIICLRIADEYEYMEDGLIRQLESTVYPHIRSEDYDNNDKNTAP
jgi:predicted protein tyrosine phosphatase